MSANSGISLRRAGRTGLHLPVIGMGLGKWGQPGCDDEAACFRILDRALELGVTHWDTASGYGGGNSERIVGRWFASRGKDVRDRIQLSTKWAGPHGAGRGFLRKAVDGCLRRLQTEYLDIFMLHNPCADEHGRYYAPLEETWGTLDDLVSEGKIHYVGLSNAHGINLRDAVHALAAVGKDTSRRLAVVENCYNAIRRGQVGRGLWTDWRRGSSEAAFLDELEVLGVGLIPFWPLAAGALSGRYRKATLRKTLKQCPVHPRFRLEYLVGRTFEAIEELGVFADRKGITLAQLAAAWLLANPRVTSVICGVSSLQQLEENAAAARISLSAAELQQVDSIASGAETVDEFIARERRQKMSASAAKSP